MESKSIIAFAIFATIVQTANSFSYQPPAFQSQQRQQQRAVPMPVSRPVASVPVPVRSSSYQPKAQAVKSEEPVYRGKTMQEAEIIALETSGSIVPVMP